MTIDPEYWLGPVNEELRARLQLFAAAVWDQGWAAGASDAYDDNEGREHAHGETVAPNPYRTEETTK